MRYRQEGFETALVQEESQNVICFNELFSIHKIAPLIVDGRGHKIHFNSPCLVMEKKPHRFNPPGARFSKVPKSFRKRKAIAKFQTL